MNYQPPQPGQPVPANPGQPAIPQPTPPQPGQPVPANPNYAPAPEQPGIIPVANPQPAHGTQVPGTENPYYTPQSQAGMMNMDTDKVSNDVLNVLMGTKGWVKFVSILIFVFVGLFALIYLLAMGNPFISKGQLFFQFLILAAYGFAGFKLFQFSKGIDQVLLNPDSETLADALDKQRVFWKFIGILAIITIIAIVILFIAIFAAIARMTNDMGSY